MSKLEQSVDSKILLCIETPFEIYCSKIKQIITKNKAKFIQK